MTTPSASRSSRASRSTRCRTRRSVSTPGPRLFPPTSWGPRSGTSRDLLLLTHCVIFNLARLRSVIGCLRPGGNGVPQPAATDRISLGNGLGETLERMAGDWDRIRIGFPGDSVAVVACTRKEERTLTHLLRARLSGSAAEGVRACIEIHQHNVHGTKDRWRTGYPCRWKFGPARHHPVGSAPVSQLGNHRQGHRRRRVSRGRGAAFPHPRGEA